MDIEMLMSMAPGLSMLYVFEGTSGDQILNSMVSSNEIKQFSCSWGLGYDPTAEGYLLQMAAQGQTFLTASGDGDAWVVPVGGDWPADDPWVTSVGGTQLTMNGSGASYFSETVWNSGSAGTCGGWSDNPDKCSNTYWGSGGGVSTTWPIPAWQLQVNMPSVGGSSSMRNFPDVALTAYGVWVNYNHTTCDAEGTSIAAPLWAGFVALVNQEARGAGYTPVGFLNQAIYTIGSGANYNSCFHDITTGSNTWSGSPGSPDKYYAASGYDLCTGWGTPNGQNLINALVRGARVSPAAPFVNTQPASETVNLGSSASFYVMATGYTPLSIQWFKDGSQVIDGGRVQIANGANANGTDDSTLTISDVVTLDEGQYWAVITNWVGSVTSSVAVLTVTNGGSTTKIISLSGNLAFGSVTVETSAQSTLTISNTGNATLTVSNISYPSGFSGAWMGAIVPGGAQDVTVTFSPPAANSYGGVLTVTSDATSGNNMISVSGTGVSGSGTTRIIAVSGNLDFGNVQVGTSAQRTLTIWSQGNTNLDVSGINCPAGFSGPWAGSIVAGSATNITVTFVPSAAQNYGGQVTVNSDATSGSGVMNVFGTGTLAPPPSAITNYEVLFSFPDFGVFGMMPQAMLVEGNEGALYGTTYEGGTNNVGSGGNGTVFKINKDGSGYELLHSFGPRGSGDGISPYAGPVKGSDGGLYGTTYAGGAYRVSNAGTVFKMNQDGSGYTVLHSFGSGIDGYSPEAALIEASDGRLYGTACNGGPSIYNGGGTNTGAFGIVFGLNKDGRGYQIIHTFTGGAGTGNPNGDGSYPIASLVEDTDGALYGTTPLGQGTTGYGNVGVIFKVNKDGSGYGILHNFGPLSGTDGQAPRAGLVDVNGVLYGTTASGGGSGAGTVFRINQDGTGYGVLHNFSFTGDGGEPWANLSLSPNGALCGTTENGGINSGGIAFAINQDGSGYTILHSFGPPNSFGDGFAPQSGLCQGSDGNLYGTAQYGGTYGEGTVYRLSAAAPPISTGLSTITVAPSSVPADGISPITVTITLVDATTNPVPGKAVVVQALGAIGNKLFTPTVIQPSTLTGANGQTTAAITSTSQGWAEVSASDVTDSMAIQQQQVRVQFTALTPAILIQPSGQTVECGSNATLAVTATGEPPLSYQWYLFGTNALSGATNASLRLADAPLSDSAGYTVVVTNAYGSVTSQVATVIVQDTTPPLVMLNGSVVTNIAQFTQFTDPGATAYDTCAGVLPVGTNGSVNVNVLGTYVISYIAADPSGNSATNSRTVNVLSALQPQPAVKVLQNVTGPRTDPPALDNTNLLLAVRFGSIDCLTNQGISFVGLTPYGSIPAPFATTFLNYTLTFDAPAFGSASGTINYADLNGDPLWETIIWPSAQSGSLTISGLDPNQAYMVRLLFGDPRGGPEPTYVNGTQTFTVSDGNYATTQLTFGGAGTPTELALITVGVSGSTSLRVDSPQAGLGIGYSALLINAASEADVPAGIKRVIPANPVWTNTGLSLTAGELVDITAYGLWSWGGGHISGPNGDTNYTATWDLFYAGAPGGSLVAYVGESPYQGHSGDGTFFPQPTGYWSIGTSNQFISPTAGELWLGYNDDAVDQLTNDNSGSVLARISTAMPNEGAPQPILPAYSTNVFNFQSVTFWSASDSEPQCSICQPGKWAGCYKRG